jgi:hypothetical protein
MVLPSPFQPKNKNEAHIIHKIVEAIWGQGILNVQKCKNCV